MSFYFFNFRNVEPYVENICTKFASTKQGDDAPDRFLPHRSNEAPIRGGKSPGGKSPRQEAAEGHSIQEIPIKDSLILQRNQAQATVVSFIALVLLILFLKLTK